MPQPAPIPEGGASNNYPQKLYALSLGASKVGKHAEAHQLLCVGLQHAADPELRSIMLFARSMTRARLGRYSEALQDADSLMRIRPAWSKAHECRGVALHGLGLDDAAFAAYKTCLKLDPANDSAILVFQEREKSRGGQAAAGQLPASLGFADVPAFPGLTPVEALPPLPPPSQPRFSPGGTHQNDAEQRLDRTDFREKDGVSSGSKLPAAAAASPREAKTEDVSCGVQPYEDENFLLASQQEQQLRREVQWARQAKIAEDAEILWRAQQDESQRMWSAERDAMFEQVEQYRHSLSQIQGTAQAVGTLPPVPVLVEKRLESISLFGEDAERTGATGVTHGVKQEERTSEEVRNARAAETVRGMFVAPPPPSVEARVARSTKASPDAVPETGGALLGGALEADALEAHQAEDAAADEHSATLTASEGTVTPLPSASPIYPVSTTSSPKYRGTNRARMLHLKRLAQAREIKAAAPSPPPPGLMMPEKHNARHDESDGAASVPPLALPLQEEEECNAKSKHVFPGDPSAPSLDQVTTGLTGDALSKSPTARSDGSFQEQRPIGLVEIYPDLRGDTGMGEDGGQLSHSSMLSSRSAASSRLSETNDQENEYWDENSMREAKSLHTQATRPGRVPSTVNESPTFGPASFPPKSAASSDEVEVQQYDDVPVPPPLYREVLPLRAAGALRAGMVDNAWKGVKLLSFRPPAQAKSVPIPLFDVPLPTYQEVLSLLKPGDPELAHGIDAKDEPTPDALIKDEDDHDQTKEGERELVLTMFEAHASGEEGEQALVCASVLSERADLIGMVPSGSDGTIEAQFANLKTFSAEGLLNVRQTIAFSHMMQGETDELEPLAGESAVLYLSIILIPHGTGAVEQQSGGRMLGQVRIPVSVGACAVASYQFEDVERKPLPGSSIRIGYAYQLVTAPGDESLGPEAARKHSTTDAKDTPDRTDTQSSNKKSAEMTQELKRTSPLGYLDHTDRPASPLNYPEESHAPRSLILAVPVAPEEDAQIWDEIESPRQQGQVEEPDQGVRRTYPSSDDYVRDWL